MAKVYSREKRVREQMDRMKQMNCTEAELLLLRETAKAEAAKMADEMLDKAFLYMLAIPLNVLVGDRWSKSGKKLGPGFTRDCLSMYDSVKRGVITDEELIKVLEVYGNVDIEKEWEEQHRINASLSGQE